MSQTTFPCPKDVPRALVREFTPIFPGPIQDYLEGPITSGGGVSETVWILLQEYIKISPMLNLYKLIPLVFCLLCTFM